METNVKDLANILLSSGITWEYDGAFHVFGGPGSGHHGHAGRPGKQGGSAPGSPASLMQVSSLRDAEAILYNLNVAGLLTGPVTGGAAYALYTGDFSGVGDIDILGLPPPNDQVERAQGILGDSYDPGYVTHFYRADDGSTLQFEYMSALTSKGRIIKVPEKRRVFQGIPTVPLEYLIRSYQASGRPKDLVKLDVLSVLGDEFSEPPLALGGPGSGHHGHAGRPGKRGGSAVKGFKIMGDEDVADSWGKAHYAEWANSLPEDQAAAIHHYTDGGYIQINEALRGDAEWRVEEYAYAIDDALASAPPIPEDIVLQREVGEFILELEEYHNVGDVFTDKAFVSTSVASFADPEYGTLSINVPKGTSGAYIRSLSEHKSSEYELLLARRTKFRLVSLDPVVVEVVGQEDLGSEFSEDTETKGEVRYYAWLPGDVVWDVPLALSEFSSPSECARYLVENDFHFRTNGVKFVVLGGPGSGHYGHAGRLGKRGGSVARSTARIAESIAERMVNKDSEGLATDYVVARIERVASKQSVSSEEVEDKAMANLKGALESGEIAVMVPGSVLDEIMQDGRFKNQHETGTSMGNLDTGLRAEAEQNAFNIAEGASSEDFPVYGFVSTPGSNDPTSYGDIKLILRDGVKDRATITLDDSLFGFDEKQVAGTPYRDPRKGSLDYGVKQAFEASSPKELAHSVQYIEAQIHGGLSVKDIVRIVSTNRWGAIDRNEEIAQKLGIPHERGWS